MRRKLIAYLLVFTFFLSLFNMPPATVNADSDEDIIFVIPMEGPVEKGLDAFLKRSLTAARDEGATVVVIEMNTLGGSVDAAMSIGNRLIASEIPVITYITGTATSAGAYIALNTPMIAMSPGSTIGAAEPRFLTGQEVDPKILAFWKSEMEAAAEAFDRDPIYAAAMVDRSVVIEGLVNEEQLLSLTANKATEVGIADGVFTNRQQMLDHYGYSGQIIQADITLAERLARFVTSPNVIPFLLTIAFLGIAIEFLVPGFGLPGILGVSALAIFFIGHMAAGAAGYEVLIIFIIGIILLSIEFFAPGFGIFGISGIVAMGAAIVLAAQDTTLGMQSLLIALAITFVVSIILVKYFGYRGIWSKFILSEKQQNELGYVAPQQRKDLLGQIGETITPLRPSGTAQFDDYLADVVGEGGYIQSGRKVKVVKVEGTRIVVREIKES
ncbi:NfeD family protein [Desulfuribacillus alkaliarsenatis]|uniref:Uncharacterized protein n=1 Tax=Desulfuribacillus alkaliarsenatis TaxID=766136 RepID=A0A1E5G1A7_9FIRM|nr:NfeD family protein [Desulfuribacillus alkaliarsenatis]OEF96228.1 hypothetical protein BHF68_08670 [Desulfuribacillus alkaliarsenatis]